MVTKYDNDRQVEQKVICLWKVGRQGFAIRTVFLTLYGTMRGACLPLLQKLENIFPGAFLCQPEGGLIIGGDNDVGGSDDSDANDDQTYFQGWTLKSS